jgi:hypothetical protein
MWLWHRFHAWRAMRMYRWVERMEGTVKRVTAKADALFRQHVEDPQKKLPGID